MPDPISSAGVPPANACYPEDDVSACTGSDAGATPTTKAPTQSPSQPSAVDALVKRLSVATGSGGSGSSLRSSSGQEVLFCHRVADIPFNSHLHLEHHFLATSSRAGGAGHCGDGVPGHGHIDLPLSSMCVVDHAAEVGAPGVTCEPVVADESCVERALQPGAYLGPWAPPFNDCQTFVARVLAECALDPDGGVEGASGLGGQGGSPGL